MPSLGDWKLNARINRSKAMRHFTWSDALRLANEDLIKALQDQQEARDMGDFGKVSILQREITEIEEHIEWLENQRGKRH